MVVENVKTASKKEAWGFFFLLPFFNNPMDQFFGAEEVLYIYM